MKIKISEDTMAYIVVVIPFLLLTAFIVFCLNDIYQYYVNEVRPSSFWDMPDDYNERLLSSFALLVFVAYPYRLYAEFIRFWTLEKFGNKKAKKK